jgi:replicative DNA helicase
MSKELSKLRDTGSERALLGTIIRGGKDAFIDADGIVDATDFSLPINKSVYASLKALSEEPNCESFDVETIKMKMKSMGFGDQISNPKDLEYLELLDSVNFDKGNIPMFGIQIKKYSVVRDLYLRYTDAIKYLSGISGNESLSDIIKEAEGRIIDYVTGVDNENSLEQLSENLEEYIQQKLQEEEVDQVGLPTGYPIWDEAIGGGLRRGTVTVKGARPKTGKSFDALNVGINVAKLGIPVLYLDTELTSAYQKNRMICINSGCPIYKFETGRFKREKNWVDAVVESAHTVNNIPFFYESISGMSHTEALALARRWLVKHVGFNEDGKAKDCLIIYDYMKLTSGANLTSVTPEYIVLGLMLTEMHNFCVKYDLPILGYVQLNRDGIDGEDTNVVAGSDRILWLCSSLTLLRNKDENDLAMGSKWEHGNKKLVVLETRHGSGIETYGDYINLHASLRPNVSRDEACGLIREGLLHSAVCTGPINGSGTNQQGDSREYKGGSK